MKLCYRGIPHTCVSQTVPVVPGDVVGNYRGAPVRLRRPVESVHPSTVAILKYRGISYVSARSFGLNESLA